MTYFNALQTEFRRSRLAYVFMLVFYLVFCLISQEARNEWFKLLLIITIAAGITLAARAVRTYTNNKK